MSQSIFIRFSAWAAFAVTAILALAAVVQADSPAAPKATLVKIHADWCGTCTMLDSTWQALRNEYGENVRFVVLDVTDRSTVERSRAEAERLGIADLFDRYKSSTGTVAIVDSGTGKVVRVLRGELDAGKYRPAIASLVES